MQTNDAEVVNSKIRYLDPLAICEARHAGPSTCKDDDNMLKQCKTHKEKQEKVEYITKRL